MASSLKNIKEAVTALETLEIRGERRIYRKPKGTRGRSEPVVSRRHVGDNIIIIY